MKWTFKHLLYVIVLIGFVAFTFATCSKQVIQPFLEKQPEFQEELVYQKTQEARIRANVEQLLEKLLGKKTFVVSVVSTLVDKDTTEYSLIHEPQVISSNTTIRESSEEQLQSTVENSVEGLVSLSDDGAGESYLELRPSATAIQQSVDSDEVTVFSVDQIASTIVDLPGFPRYDQTTYSMGDSGMDPSWMIERPFDAESNANTGERVDEGVSSQQFLKEKQHEDNQIILNKRTIESKIPRKIIKHVIVSVVIDEEFFNYLDLEQETVEGLISSVAGLDAARGDQLHLSFVPFLDKEFSWQHFLKKNKIWVEKFAKLYQRSKPVLMGLLGALVLAAFLFGLMKFLKWNKQRKEAEREAAEKEKQQEEEKTKEQKMNEIEEKKQSLLQLAQTKPEQFTTLLTSWTESDEPLKGDKS